MNDPMITCMATRWREDAVTWTSDAKRALRFSTEQDAGVAATVAGGMPRKGDAASWLLVNVRGLYCTETGLAYAKQRANER